MLSLPDLYTMFPALPLWCREGFYMQQDAEECWTSLMYTLREKLKVRFAPTASLVDQSKRGPP